jgi:hypothetical protein
LAPLAYARGTVPKNYLAAFICAHKTKIPAAFSARRDLDSFALLFSGRPIGEPRRNYRYRDNRDNNAYYNDVENKSADAQLRLAAKGREVELAVGTTIGHSIFQSEEMGCLKQAKPV